MRTWQALAVLAAIEACKAPTPAAASPKLVDAAVADIASAQADVDAHDLDSAVQPDIVPDLPGEVSAVAPDQLGDSTLDTACAGDSPGACDAGVTPTDIVQPTDPNADSFDSLYPAGAGKAPKVVVLPWPPACAKPHVNGDGGKDYGGPNCFDPPSYCNYPGNSSASPGCSPDGQFCCVFPSNCLPCEWVSCFGCPNDPACPPQCLAQPQYWEPGGEVWGSPECTEFGKIVASQDCALCDADVYCKWQ